MGTFFDELSQTGEQVSLSNAIIHILIDIDPKQARGPNQCLEGIPSPDALAGACLQAHITFADALSGTQLGGIVVQENFRMGKHHQ